MNTTIKKKQGGFSIAEMLIAIFILTVIGVVMANFQIDIFSLNRISNDNLVAQEEARSILKNMAAEIRSLSQAADGSYAIAQAGTSSLIFFTDTDNDGVKEKVRYFLAGTTLKKGMTEPSGNPSIYNPTGEAVREMIHDLANGTTSVFSYYDADYDGQSDPLAQPVNPVSVRLIKIDVTIDRDSKRDPPPFHLTTQVSCRNLKDNL